MNTHDIELPPLPEFDRLSSMHADDVANLLSSYGRKCARAAIEADRNRWGEPVGYIMPTAIKQLKAGGNTIVGGVSQGCDVPIYTAPQPAEPVNVPLDKAGAVGRAFSLVRRLKDGEPVEDELRQVIRQIAAEPVKDEQGYCNLDLACEGGSSCDACRPSEPVKVPNKSEGENYG